MSLPDAKQRFARGKKLRDKIPRSSHGKFVASRNRPNPIELLKASDEGRIPALLAIRYQRMRQSPFAFLRGAAVIMAADLSRTPVTGLRVQACGDCHVANFGGFATPERRLVFDINDFDETLPAPWEWDVKRLATSFVLAIRDAGLSEHNCQGAARAATHSYRTHMREYAEMSALKVWYSHLEVEILAEKASGQKQRKQWLKLIAKAESRTSSKEFPKIAAISKGRARILDHPPLIYHPREIGRLGKMVGDIFHRYRETLPPERRIVLDRYALVDVARKVVGVGAVGTRCAVALLLASPKDALLLQFKEARRSVLEPFAGTCRYKNQGERVVVGQRLLQSASDVFLGWTSDNEGRDYYFRQLRDMKMKIDLAEMSKSNWLEYAELCGWVLARAHARTGDPAAISGYLGKNDAFEEAIEEFALSYAEQTERDYTALLKAIRSGKINARAAKV
jgi:uncharacterized protein (DUF2252 family)